MLTMNLAERWQSKMEHNVPTPGAGADLKLILFAILDFKFFILLFNGTEILALVPDVCYAYLFLTSTFSEN